MQIHFLLTEDDFIPNIPQPLGKQRVRSGNGNWYTPSKTVGFSNIIANKCWLTMVRDGVEMFKKKTPLKITVLAYRIDKRRCDADNILKVTQDALNGVAYHDDSQIADARIVRLQGQESPLLYVKIELANSNDIIIPKHLYESE